MTLIVSRDESGKVSVSFTSGDTSFSTSAQDGQGASWSDAYAERQLETADTPKPVEPAAAPVEPAPVEPPAAAVEQPVERNAGQQDIVPPAPDPQPVVEEQSGGSPTGSSATDPAAPPTTEGL